MKINVDMNQLLQNAAFIQNQAQEYAKTYQGVYQLLQQMEGVWSGKDYQAFAQQLQAFQKDFEQMKQVLEEYARYLRESAAVYSRLQSDCTAMANRLRY